MQGELAYKDRHGRVWMIHESTDFTSAKWSAETLDKGHTDEWLHVSADIELLLSVVDGEEYRIDRASFPLETGAPGGEHLPPSRETIAEILQESRSDESAVNPDEYSRGDSTKGSTDGE